MDEDLKLNRMLRPRSLWPNAWSGVTGFILDLYLLCVSTQDFLNSMSALNFPLPQLAESDFFLGTCYFRLVAHPNTNISLLLGDRTYLVCFTETLEHLANSCWYTKPFETWGLVFMVQSLAPAALRCLEWSLQFSFLNSLLPYPISWLPTSISKTNPQTTGISWVLLLYYLNAPFWN